MPDSPLNEKTHQDAEEVRQFFDQWHLYKKIVGFNYLDHREAFGAIAELLNRIPSPFSFVDLGCGDAAWTSRVLAGHQFKSYEGVDLSSVALKLAEENLAAQPCEKHFVQEDFSEYIQRTSTVRDVVFIGLSLHHLPDKREFFARMRGLVAPTGSFVFFEPAKEPGESCQQYLDRWFQGVERNWTELTPEESAQVHDHVYGSDYPETVDDYTRLAREAGFPETEVLFRDAAGYYAVIHCHGA